MPNRAEPLKEWAASVPCPMTLKIMATSAHVHPKCPKFDGRNRYEPIQWVFFFSPTSNTKSFSQRALVSPPSEASVLVKRKLSSTSHPKATIISHNQTNRELLPLDHLVQMRFHLDLLQSIHHHYPIHPWYFPAGRPASHFHRF